jgi:hypothetical protein
MIWLLALLRRGSTSAFLASHLGISENTAWNMRRRIFGHLSRHNACRRFAAEPRAILFNVVKVKRLERSQPNRAKHAHCAVLSDGRTTFFKILPLRNRTVLQNLLKNYCSPSVEIVTISDHSAAFMQNVELSRFHQHREAARVNELWRRSSHNSLLKLYAFQREIVNTYSSISSRFAQGYLDDFLLRQQHRRFEADLFFAYLKILVTPSKIEP